MIGSPLSPPSTLSKTFYALSKFLVELLRNLLRGVVVPCNANPWTSKVNPRDERFMFACKSGWVTSIEMKVRAGMFPSLAIYSRKIIALSWKLHWEDCQKKSLTRVDWWLLINGVDGCLVTTAEKCSPLVIIVSDLVDMLYFPEWQTIFDGTVLITGENEECQQGAEARETFIDGLNGQWETSKLSLLLEISKSVLCK